MGKECSTYGEKKTAYKVLVGKSEGKRPLERPRHSWEDNIETNIRYEMVWTGFIWLR
jgi:hypothetical protein